MLSLGEIRNYYSFAPLRVPPPWNLSRKHFRIELFNHKFLKLNKFENRINGKELKKYCLKYAPIHVYFSALNWLFPERVGEKSRANHAYPINGEYVVDIDSYLAVKFHEHCYYSSRTSVCYECLRISKALTLQVCEKIKEYYSKIKIVFSGRRGFHIHVCDFNLEDWTHYNEKNPIKSHEVARFKFSRIINLSSFVFDRHHFILSVDPMRVLVVPSTLNGETGLICSFIGSCKQLERYSVRGIIENSNVARYIYSHPEFKRTMKLFAMR